MFCIYFFIILFIIRIIFIYSLENIDDNATAFSHKTFIVVIIYVTVIHRSDFLFVHDTLRHVLLVVQILSMWQRRS